MARLGRAKNETDRALPPATAALILRARDGDRKATEALIGLYQEFVARFVIAETGDQAHYEDLCQTIFVKMVLALPRLRAVARFEPWLFQIARNVCRDHGRRRRFWRRFFVPYDPDDPAHEPPSVPDARPGSENDAERNEKMQRGIARLPPGQRRLLLLSLEQERSYAELARLSQTSVASVKSRLHRARENLRWILLTGESE